MFFPLLLLFSLFSSAHANEEKDEFDMSWLDEDKVIYVVQPRKIPKVDRFEFALSGGIKVDSPFRTTRILMPRLYHYFTEKLGAALTIAIKQNDQSSEFLRVKNESSVLPNVRDMRNFYGMSFLWMPFFAKMNFFNKLTYMDWHFELGLGQANTEIDLNFNPTNPSNIDRSSHLTLLLGTGHRYTLGKNFTARIELLAMLYNAASGVGGRITTKEVLNKDYQITAGIGYTF
jgi:outer membrane beta-barrel protein